MAIRITKKSFGENLMKKFVNTYTFSNYDINKFVLLLRQGVYPYENMDDWEKLNETSLTEKEKDCFYNCLNMKDVTDADYVHIKSIVSSRSRVAPPPPPLSGHPPLSEAN